MEEEFSRSDFASSVPSDDDDLDRAIAEAEKAAAEERARASGAELEDDDGDREDDDTANDDAPGRTDYEDDSEADEANTPADDEDEVEVKPLESRKKTAEKQGSHEDNEKPLSRKQRGRVIEEYRQELMQSEAKRKQLEETLAKQKAEEEALNHEVSRALGTDEEYEKAVEDGLAGDKEAAEKARIWKANRAFYRKLVNRAGVTYQEEFAKAYFDTLQNLPGINMDIATGNDLTKIIQHVHEAGQSQAAEKYKAQIEKLQRDIETWKGRAKAQGPKAASETRRSPLTGGGESVSEKTFDWERHYLDKDGLPTDEFDSLVRQHGVEAVTSGKFFKRGK